MGAEPSKLNDQETAELEQLTKTKNDMMKELHTLLTLDGDIYPCD
jgi:hypothetical protein